MLFLAFIARCIWRFMRIQNLSKYDGKRAFAAKFYDITKAKDRSLVLFHNSISVRGRSQTTFTRGGG